MLKIRNKKQITLLFSIALALVGILSGVGLKWEELCLKNNFFQNCYQFGNGVLGPAFTLSVSIIVSLLPLFFLKEEVYKTWRNFAVFYLPVAIVLIVASPEYSSGFLGGGWSMTPDREETTMWLAGLFIVISYILIITKSFSLRGK